MLCFKDYSGLFLNRPRHRDVAILDEFWVNIVGESHTAQRKY